jgi:polyhydroxyalkanoate synthase subunit PhaC
VQSGAPPRGTEAFKVGEAVAVTPGKVVLRTPLAEVIQYAPATERVHPEPADATRMPYCMHSQYLRSLFLKNDLAEGRFKVDGRPVALPDIRVPLFVVATERDHVAPWRSVFKFHLLTKTQITFVLTNGGHNAGILSEPGHPHRHFRIAVREHNERYVDPDTWFAEHKPQTGSWWSAWSTWLGAWSGQSIPPPPVGDAAAAFAALEDAPGRYVFMR